MLLIGSRALSLRGINFRKPIDFDFICTQEEFEKFDRSRISPTKEYAEGDNKMIIEGSPNCEFEIVKPGTSAEMLVDMVSRDPMTMHTSLGMVPNTDLLFTIKASHRYKKNSPHFWKTLGDYHRLKALGAKVRPEYVPFLKLREKESYAYKHPSLNRSKKDFFSGDGIVYEWEHDDIHEAIKLYDKPAYRYYMKDGAEVQTDKAKFFACNRSIQLAGVIEEACTLAIERSLVPHPGVLTPEQAWRMALSKVCTSITSGYFREFSYENAIDVLKAYPTDYYDRFLQAVSEGRVRRALTTNDVMAKMAV